MLFCAQRFSTHLLLLIVLLSPFSPFGPIEPGGPDKPRGPGGPAGHCIAQLWLLFISSVNVFSSKLFFVLDLSRISYHSVEGNNRLQTVQDDTHDLEEQFHPRPKYLNSYPSLSSFEYYFVRPHAATDSKYHAFLSA